MERPERLELKSVDGAQLNLDALYQIAPSCFTEAKDPKTGKIKRVVNFDVLRQLLGDDTIEDATEAYEFNWVGKQEARAEVLRPINKTLRPVKEDSVDWDNTQNLYIEGDNLEVLKLLQKSYLGKVKMIYIDPPYNTGNDFVYHDDFAQTQAEYDEASGAVDELGNRYWKNTDSNGKYHSDWCSMIYSRLMVARSLLSEDGVIFISIDDNEVDNLRKICDEVFGITNFIAQFTWKKKQGGGNDSNYVVAEHEYIICFSKDITKVYIGLDKKYMLDDNLYPFHDDKGDYGLITLDKASIQFSQSLVFEIKDRQGNSYYPRIVKGKQSCWRWGQNKVKEQYDDLVFKNGKVYTKYYRPNGVTPRSLLVDSIYGRTESGNDDIKALFQNNPFSYPKPVALIKNFFCIGTKENDLVLDFFSGSSTSAQAVFNVNSEDSGKRKFIMVQLPEAIEKDSDAYNDGFKNICEIGKERIRRAGKKIKEEHPEAKDLDIGFRVFRIDESNFEDVERTPKEYNQDQLELFLNNVKGDRTDLDLLFGCMLDWGVQLSLPMTSEEVDGKMIYTVNDGDLVACFADKVTDSVVRAMADKHPLRVIFRDSCFEQDADKINIYETFKQLLDWSDEDVEKNIRVI